MYHLWQSLAPFVPLKALLELGASRSASFTYWLGPLTMWQLLKILVAVNWGS